MASNLVKKVIQGVGFISALSVGVAGFLGCKTGAGYTMMQHPDPRVRGIGSMMHHEGVHEENMQEAREGRDVYNNQENQQRNVYGNIKQEKPHFFACNYWKDFNNNGAGDYPEEYVGIKKTFIDNEKIILVSYDRAGTKGTKLDVKIFNPQGEEIYNDGFIYPRNGILRKYGENDDLMNKLIQKGGYGNFKVVYYINGNYAGSNEFEIHSSNILQR